jgi:hypothetical protein
MIIITYIILYEYVLGKTYVLAMGISVLVRLLQPNQDQFVLPNTYYERMELEEIYLSARWHPSSSHYIELYIVQKLDLVK